MAGLPACVFVGLLDSHLWSNNLMNDRQNETPMIPSIKPDQDEVAAFQNSRRSEAPRQSNFNGILVFVIVLMAIVMGVGGFLLYEFQKQLKESELALLDAQRQNKDLLEGLAKTDMGVYTELKIHEGKIATNFSEIDKLWQVSNKRNKGQIKNNENNLKAVQSQLKVVGDANTRMSTSVTTIETGFAQLTTDVAAMQQLLQDDSEEMTTQVALVRGQVQDAAVEVGGNKRNIAALQKKLAATEEDIAAFDEYRLQVNKQLLELRRVLQDVGGETSAPAPAASQ